MCGQNDYRRIDTGEQTTSDDPERGIWYAASGKCGYWTDDWSKLENYEGIPCCPRCGCVGLQTTAANWFDISEGFLKTHPRYDEWLPTSKETCERVDFIKRYYKWCERD